MMSFLKVRDDLKLFYTDEGECEGALPLLFVHGWGCDSHDWCWQLDYFTQRTRVIAVDLRGHGASSVMPAGGYEARVFAEDLALLLRALGVPEVIAIGHSLGGLVVAAFAVEHPDLTGGIVTIDPAHGLSPADATSLIAAAETMTAENAAETGAAMVGFIECQHTPDFFRSWHRRKILSFPGYVLAESFTRIWIGPEALGNRANAEVYLNRRACPALTIYTGPHTESAQWATTHSCSGLDEVQYLPLGHWPHQEMPGLFNTMIENWTARLPSSAISAA